MAVLLVAAASLATRLLAGMGDTGISPQFFAAVFLATWYGGLGPGLIATILSGLATGYLLILPHVHSGAPFKDDILRIAIFTLIAFATGSLHSATKRAKEAAESASAAKTRFLAMVSHELRTPLSPVLMIAEFLEQDSRLPADLLGDVDSIRRHVALELRIIEDLVDLSRISTGKMSLQLQPVDVHEPLKSAIELCMEDVREKELNLTTQFSGRACTCMADSVRLQQVFWNLIRNAVKFTPERGEVIISTRDGTDQRIVVEITDTGIGIDRGKLSAIFAAFEQGGPGMQERFGGLGLGLAICDGLVRAHRGSIAASSEGKGRGATFRVELPVAGASA